MASNPPKAGAPERIGRYQVIERIGRGAMGVVYRARDEAMGREVALKVLVADLAEEPEIRARFLREAESAARLSHPNVIKIFDAGEEHGRFYIVMELLRGATLKDYLTQNDSTSLEHKLDLMIQLCGGLSAAHNASIYHRDIKPGNIFVRNDGSLKILDFGVARVASSNMTAAGFVLGTPDYMSPEQARGNVIDGRSDIFSAGGVFYFMVTGRKPFAAKDLPTIFRQVQFEDPVPLQPKEAPPELARVIMKALAKDRALRHQSCAELMADLAEIRSQCAVADTLQIARPASTLEVAGTAADVSAQPEVPGKAASPPTPPTHVGSPVAAASHVPAASRVDRLNDEEIATFAAPPKSATPPKSDETLDSVSPTSIPTVATPSRSAPVTDSAPKTTPLPSRRPAPEPVTGPKLVVYRGDAIEYEIPLVGKSIRIGRDAKNDLVLRDSTNSVSPFHAEIRAEGGTYTIVDLNSQRGLWVEKRRVPSVRLGASGPVTVGPYELTYEDDGSAEEFASTGGVSAAASAPKRTPVSPPAPVPFPSPALPSRPASSAPMLPRDAATVGPIQLWSDVVAAVRRTPVWARVAAAIVAVIGVSIAIAQYSQAPSTVVSSPAPEAPPAAPPSKPVEPTPAPNPNAQQIAEHLAEAQTLIANGSAAEAIRDHLDPVLTLEPQNVDALALKAQAEELIAKGVAPTGTKAGRGDRKGPSAPDVALVAGIPRLTNETAKAYDDRSKRILTRYALAKAQLEQKEFAAAISNFQAVERDLTDYLDVRSLMAEAATQRSAALREAMDSGARNEAAGQFKTAWQWYVRAEQYDPSSPAAEKVKAMRERMTKDAVAALDRAHTFEAMRRPADASRLYQQVADSLPEGDETREKALQQLRALKP